MAPSKTPADIADDRFVSAQVDPRFARQQDDKADVALDERFASLNDPAFQVADPTALPQAAPKVRRKVTRRVRKTQSDEPTPAATAVAGDDTATVVMPTMHNEDASCRFACVNLSWDHMSADDIFVVLSSFLPPTGTLRSVVVVPSAYGKERLAHEAVYGPDVYGAKDPLAEGLPAIVHTTLEKPDDRDESDIDDAAERKELEERLALRRYELDRLRYYYAIAEFDSAESALAVYAEVDGLEYERTSTVFDLRFVPDGQDLTEALGSPRDVCTELPARYNGRDKANVASSGLQSSSGDLSWEKPGGGRPNASLLLANRKFTEDELEKLDLEDYLAGSSEDEPSDGEADRFRALLASGEGGESGDELSGGPSGADAEDSSSNSEARGLTVSFVPGLTEFAEEVAARAQEKAIGGAGDDADDAPADETDYQRRLRLKREARAEKRREKRRAERAAAKAGKSGRSGSKDVVSPAIAAAESKTSDAEQSGSDLEGSFDAEAVLEAEAVAGVDNDPTGLDALFGADSEEDFAPDSSLEFDLVAERKAQRLRKEAQASGRKGRQARSALQKLADSGKISTEAASLTAEDAGVADVAHVASDGRFSDLFSDPAFAVDRTAPDFVDTAATETLAREAAKARRRALGLETGDEAADETAETHFSFSGDKRRRSSSRGQRKAKRPN
jgi:hypothetical protein